MSADGSVRVVALEGIPEVVAGDDVAALVGDALDGTAGVLPLTADDVLIVTQKIVSKAEGAIVDLTGIEPRPEAIGVDSPPAEAVIGAGVDDHDPVDLRA